MKLSTYASKVNAQLKRNKKEHETAGFFLCLCSCRTRCMVKNGKELHEQFKSKVDTSVISAILSSLNYDTYSTPEFVKASYKARIIYMKQFIAELKEAGL